jgi:hypothetical protein
MQPGIARITSNVRIAPNVSFHDLDGEAVMLNLESGKYYGLDEVGTRMWNLMAAHGALSPVLQALLEEYDVSEERLQGDLLKLVDDLAAHGLVIIENETNPANPAA